MIQEVHALDGRSWTIRSEVNWVRTPEGREFEHDVASGRAAGIVLLVGVILVLFVLMFGAPDGVYFPFWLQLFCLAVLLLWPAQWAVSRPWTIVAETYESSTSHGEYWVGTVRGFLAARYEVSRTVRNLQEQSSPDDGRGTLAQVS